MPGDGTGDYRRIDDSEIDIARAARSFAELVLLSPSGQELRRYPLYSATTHVGRSLDCDVHIAEPWISRSHADIIISGEALSIVHLGSNPTQVNGVEVEDSHPLVNGDEILLAGRIRLRVEIDPEAGTRPQTGETPSPPRDGETAAAAREASSAEDDIPLSPEDRGPLDAHYEIVIVGAGPGGLAAGVRAASHGLTHVVLERRALANTIQRYQRRKWVMDEPPRLPLQPELAMPFEASPREDVLHGWEQAARSAGVQLRIGSEFEVCAIEKEGDAFVLRLEGGAEVSARYVVLAIGVQGNQNRFAVPGHDLRHIAYQLDDASEFRDQRIVVVGAGDAGIENALALAEENDVWIVNRRANFVRAKPRNQMRIEAMIAQRRISAYLNTTVDHFEPGRIALDTDDGEALLEVDLVIGRLGATPPRRFLSEIGIEFASEDSTAVPVLSARYEASVPGLFVIGALAGYPLIKNCMNQGFEVIEHIVGNAVVPADEPELERKLAALMGSVDERLEFIQRAVPLLSKLSKVQLRDFLFGSKVREVAAGEVVYERNEFDGAFYCVLDGELQGEAAVLLDRTTPESTSLTASSAPVGSIYLAGHFFGEEALLSGRPCVETVTATRRSLVIATPSNTMIQLLTSSDSVKRVVDRTAVTRMLERFVPDSSSDERDELAQAAELLTLKAGEIFVEDGQEARGLLLIRRGSVTVSKLYEGKPVVLEYVQAGNTVGEAALLSQDSRHPARITASLLTEGVLLPVDVMRRFLEAHPTLHARLRNLASRWAMLEGKAEARKGGTGYFLLDQGLAEATDMLIIDEALCIGCDHCEKACSETHFGVSRLDRQAGPSYATTRGSVLHVPVACRHCENPKCMDDCPPDALRRDPSGEVYIRDNCIGCGNCATNCPYDVIQMQPISQPKRRNLLWSLLFGEGPEPEPEPVDPEAPLARSVAVKCDLCRELPSNRGAERGAACVAACPTGAIVRVNPRDYVDEILR